MGGYAPTPKKGKQLDLRTVPAHEGLGFVCDLCSNPTPSGVSVSHTDGADVECTDAGICDGCLEELAEYSRKMGRRKSKVRQ